MKKVELEDLIKFSKTVRVLYVENDKHFRESSYGIFKIFFHSIDVACDGAEGFKCFENNKYDLIITAIDMPNIDGVEMITKIREISKNITILITSSDTKNFIDLIRLGVDGYILKPVEINQFTMIIQKVIEKLQNKQELYEYKNQLEQMVNDKTEVLKSLNQTLEEKVISRTNQLEEQVSKVKRADRYKSEFLANMSHEIRTPLNAIMGFIDLLKEKEDDKEKQKYLDIVSSSSKSLLDIINDILDFSKIESGKVQIENIDFDPREEFVVTKKLFQAKADEKNIQLYVNYGKLPKSLNGDILRIKQIINNLISNAVKFTKENKNIYLDIDYENGSLSVNVKDEGIGINKEYQSKIFDAFSQEDCSTTRKYGGTGLGLAISYNLVKAMKGELKLKSELGVGSEFYFSIPLEIGKEIEKTVLKNTKQILKGKILVVEDNIANQMFMKVILKKIGLTFDIASDGIEAIEIFKNNQYDAILMDENMPNMNGIEATKQILEYEKENSLKHTPIIALTANALKGDRERFLEAGMDEYMTKPINNEKLSEILVEFIGDIS